jgi:hypothetical protein
MQGEASSGTHRALSRTRSGVLSRLSLRTWTPKRTSGPSVRALAIRSSQSTSQSRPASSWQWTPGGTATHLSQMAHVRATG